VYLEADGSSNAEATASAWGKLPQLRSLNLSLTQFSRQLSVDGIEGLASDIGAATGLTKLVMAAYMDKPDNPLLCVVVWRG
jgi:hypothetical protein